MIEVCIREDQGQYSVGLEPQAEPTGEQEGQAVDMMAGKPEMQPAKSLDDALAQAKQLLMTPKDAQAADEQMGFDSAISSQSMAPSQSMMGGSL